VASSAELRPGPNKASGCIAESPSERKGQAIQYFSAIMELSIILSRNQQPDQRDQPYRPDQQDEQDEQDHSDQPDPSALHKPHNSEEAQH
jgi:hypothetical protein